MLLPLCLSFVSWRLLFDWLLCVFFVRLHLSCLVFVLFVRLLLFVVCVVVACYVCLLCVCVCLFLFCVCLLSVRLWIVGRCLLFGLLLFLCVEFLACWLLIAVFDDWLAVTCQQFVLMCLLVGLLTGLLCLLVVFELLIVC